MAGFIEEVDRGQQSLLPGSLDDWVDKDNPVRVIDAVACPDPAEKLLPTTLPAYLGTGLGALGRAQIVFPRPRPGAEVSDLCGWATLFHLFVYERIDAHLSVAGKWGRLCRIDKPVSLFFYVSDHRCSSP
jgi:hypothetical protein